MNETSTKPSYLGLLNAIALGESRAGQYLSCWAEVTTNDDVRAVIRTVALREAEHGLAFSKRIDELGYCLQEREDEQAASRMEIAASTTLSDREKFEKLGLGRRPTNGSPDVFDRFFEDKTLDVQTGALLGRYIAEERDSGRRLAGCYEALCAGEAAGSPGSGAAGSGPALGDQAALEQLIARVDQLCATIAQAEARRAERKKDKKASKA